MTTRRLTFFATIPALFWLAGCTLPASGPTLSQSQVGQLQTRSLATIIKVTDVTIDGTKTSMGQYGGAVIAGAAVVPDHGVHGSGDALMVASASVVGAIAGQAIEEYATRKRAQEITIRMSNGDVFVIVQPSPPEFQVGDKVDVIHGAGGARLSLALDF